jgi:hypothetical protein
VFLLFFSSSTPSATETAVFLPLYTVLGTTTLTASEVAQPNNLTGYCTNIFCWRYGRPTNSTTSWTSTIAVVAVMAVMAVMAPYQHHYYLSVSETFNWSTSGYFGYMHSNVPQFTNGDIRRGLIGSEAEGPNALCIIRVQITLRNTVPQRTSPSV